MPYYAGGGDVVIFTGRDTPWSRITSAMKWWGNNFGKGAFPVQREKLTMNEARERYGTSARNLPELGFRFLTTKKKRRKARRRR